MRRKRTGLFAVVVGMLLATVLAFTLVGCGEKKTYSVSLSHDGANMKVGEEISVSIDANYDLGDVTWSTSDGAVATVDGGKITAVGEGTADIGAVTTDPSGKEHKLVCSVYVTAGETAEADYKIEVYRQKKDRTGYELDAAASESKKTAVGKTVTVASELYGKTGYVFDETNTGNVLETKVAEDGSAALKLYYNIKTFTVTFKADGVADVVKTVDYGDALTDIPSVPEKTGKVGKWSVSSFTNVTADMTVTAVYSVRALTVRFIVDGETYQQFDVSYGDAFTDIPAVPVKPGYLGDWDDVSGLGGVTADVDVTAVYTPKICTVTFKNGDNVYQTYEEISSHTHITAPLTNPTREADQDYEYDFAGWKVPGAVRLWNFDSDVIIDDLVLEAVYNEVRLYDAQVVVTGEKVDLPGVEAPLFAPTADQLVGTVAGVIDRGDITVKVENGVAKFRARSGEYTVRVAKGNYTADVTVVINEGNATANAYLIPQDVKVGGKSGSEKSYGGNDEGTQGTNWVKNGTDNLTLTGAAWVYVDTTTEEYTTRYYYEADVVFENVGTVVGFMPAYDGGAGSGNKLGFTYSGGNKIYWHKSPSSVWNNGQWGTNTAEYISVFYADPAAHKFAVYREDNDYYLLIDDRVIANYPCSDFGASGFGFFSVANGSTCSFNNIRYTRNADTLDAIRDYITETSQIGGAAIYSDGTKINSFVADWNLTGKDSGRIGCGNGPSYIINGGKAGSVYYAEAEFTPSHAENWVGIMINTSDKEPSSTGVWYGYGCGYGQIFRHSTAGWDSGDPLGAFDIGSTFKLGVARINDRYYVFLDDKLVISEQYCVVSGKDKKKTLPANNESGFGIFIGSNTKKDATFKNFKCTTDLSKIAKLVGSSTVAFDGATVEVKQLGNAIGENGNVIGGVPVEFTVTPESGKAIGDITLTFNGKRLSATYAEGGKYTFTPKAGGSYEIAVTYVDEGTGSIDLNVKSVTKTVGDVEYALYDVTDGSVEVVVRNMSTGIENTYNLTEATKTFDNLSAGYYVIEVKCNNNVYTYDVTVEKDKATALTGFLSSAYLGGSITIDNAEGVETTYKSYNNADVNATSGQAWSLVDGRRDTIRLTHYTYAFQNNAVGTKYYVEGVFDANQTYNFGDHIAGLLVSHGPNNLANESDVKLVAAVNEKRLMVSSILKDWDPVDTRILANLDDVFPGGYDSAKVKLGVVRDGMDYYFFLNDKFVCRYYYSHVATVSGFGVSASNALDVTITNFNYSLNEQLVDALKALAPEGEKSIDLYFITGQSNGTGYSNYNYNTAKNADERLVYGVSNVWYAGDRDSVLNPDKSGTLGWQLTRMGLGGNQSKFGAEAGMAQSLSSYYNPTSGKTAGIIKSAHGGTSLLDAIGGQNEPGGNWVSPSYEAALGTVQEAGGRTGGCYRSFIEQVKLNVSQLKAMGYTEINFKGLFWMQGESDRGDPVEYVKAFKYLASDFRRDLGTIAGTDLSNMPIIVGEISKYTSGSASAMNDTFISTQNTFPELVNDCYVVKSSPYDVRKQDGWHWTQTDMLKIGNLVGDCIKTNILK